MENLEHDRFKVGRHWRRPPYRANFPVGAGAVALGHEGARERQSSHEAGRLFPIQKTPDRGGVAPILPQSRLCAAAEQWNARPVGISADEGGIAIEAGFAVGVSQQRPLDELLPHRIRDRSG